MFGQTTARPIRFVHALLNPYACIWIDFESSQTYSLLMSLLPQYSRIQRENWWIWFKTVLVMTPVLVLGRVALGTQRPIVVKLSRERSVGLSVRAYVRRSVHCTVEKRRIGSGCRYRSDGSRDETGSGVWGSLHGKGYFWGRFGAWHCIQWGLYGVHAHYVVRFESIESLNQVIAVTYWRCSKYSKYLQNKPVGQYTSRLSRTMLTVLI